MRGCSPQQLPKHDPCKLFLECRYRSPQRQQCHGDCNSGFRRQQDRCVALPSSPCPHCVLTKPLVTSLTALCTDCNKGIVAAVFKSLGLSPETALASLASAPTNSSANPASSSLTASLVSGINQQCTAAFFTASLPADVKNTSSVSISTTSSSSTTTTNGARSARGGQDSAAVAGVMALAGFVATGLTLVA